MRNMPHTPCNSDTPVQSPRSWSVAAAPAPPPLFPDNRLCVIGGPYSRAELISESVPAKQEPGCNTVHIGDAGVAASKLHCPALWSCMLLQETCSSSLLQGTCVYNRPVVDVRLDTQQRLRDEVRLVCDNHGEPQRRQHFWNICLCYTLQVHKKWLRNACERMPYLTLQAPAMRNRGSALPASTCTIQPEKIFWQQTADSGTVRYRPCKAACNMWRASLRAHTC